MTDTQQWYGNNVIFYIHAYVTRLQAWATTTCRGMITTPVWLFQGQLCRTCNGYIKPVL